MDDDENEPRDAYGEAMTVGQLRRLLCHFDEGAKVFVSHSGTRAPFAAVLCPKDGDNRVTLIGDGSLREPDR